MMDNKRKAESPDGKKRQSANLTAKELYHEMKKYSICNCRDCGNFEPKHRNNCGIFKELNYKGCTGNEKCSGFVPPDEMKIINKIQNLNATCKVADYEEAEKLAKYLSALRRARRKEKIQWSKK